MRALLTIFCLLVLLPACGGSEDAHHTKAAKGDVSIGQGADAQVAIERLRKQKNPDWDEIRAKYELLLPLVKRSDAEWGTNYQQEIDQAFKHIKAGNDVKVHQQTLAKGLQHVVVLAIENELTRGGDKAGERVAAYFEGIRPTFVRRDKDFYNAQPTLEAAADKAIAQLQEHASPAVKRELMDAIHRTYGLCTLYEIMMIERLRDKDPKSCAVKLQEAVVFYRIIAPRVEKHDPEAHKAITDMLGASYDAMSAATLEARINDGLSGITLR